MRNFLYSNVFEIAGFGGVGSGKTIGFVYRMFIHAWGYPENVVLIGRKTATSMRETTQKEFLDYVRYLNGGTLEPGPIVKKYSKQEGKLTLTNETVVLFVHLDEIERILSMSLGSIGVDQAEELPYDTYLQLKGRLRLWPNYENNPDKLKRWQDRWEEHLKTFWGKPASKVKPRHHLTAVGNPHPGWAKLYFNERKDPATREPLKQTDMFKYFQLNTYDNMENLPAEFIRALEEQPEDWKKRFLAGDWDALEGQVYPEFRQSVHRITWDQFHKVYPDGMPKHWQRMVGLDHGSENPTSSHIVAVDEDRNIWVYKEYYKSGPMMRREGKEPIVSEHAKGIHAMCRDEPVPRFEKRLVIWGDPSVFGAGKGVVSRSVADEYLEHNISIKKANNEVLAGIMRVKGLLKEDPNHKHPLTGRLGAPRLYVMEDCEHLLDEFPSYEWKPPKDGTNKTEEPKKFNDHALDEIRYLVMNYFKASEKPKQIIVDKNQRYLENLNKRLSGDQPRQEGVIPYYD